MTYEPITLDVQMQQELLDKGKLMIFDNKEKMFAVAFNELSSWSLCKLAAQETEGFQWDIGDRIERNKIVQCSDDWAESCWAALPDYMEGTQDSIYADQYRLVAFNGTRYWGVYCDTELVLFKTIWHIC